MAIDFTMAEYPVDLSKELRGWLQKSIALADAFKIPGIAEDLRKVGERLDFPSFRLAVVGNIGSGKSTLINSLLGAPCKLPTGWLPTTVSITSITAGRQEHMRIHFPSGREELRPLLDTSWRDLTTANDRYLNPRDPLKVQLTFNNVWLKDLDAEVIDTPGIDGITGPRAMLISNLLSYCDATVMLVNAAYPLSLVEATFIEQAIIGRYVPCILIVVSKLDMLFEQGLSRNEVLQQFRLIQDRVAKITKRIPVIPAQPLNEDESETQVIMNLRSQVEAMMSKTDRRAWRSQQSASLIVDSLEQMTKIGQAILAVRRMNKTKKREARRRLESEIQKDMLEWEKINNEFMHKCESLEHKFLERLTDAQNKLIGEAGLQILQAPNPKLWWEKDFPFLVRHTFLSLARQLEALLINALAHDFRWLAEEVARRFNTKLETTQPILGDTIEFALNQHDLHLRDFERLSLFMHLGYSASTIVARIFLSHLGFMISSSEDLFKPGGAGTKDDAIDNLNHALFQTKIEKQRNLVIEVMRQNIIQTVRNYRENVLPRFREICKEISHSVQKQQISWRDGRITAFERQEDLDEQVYQRLIDDANSLRSSILGMIYPNSYGEEYKDE